MVKTLRYAVASAAMLGASLVAPPQSWAQEGDSVTLYGVKIYCTSGGANGVYSVEATPGAQPQLEWSDGDMIGSGGVVYADGTLYILTYFDFFGQVIWGYQICDFENRTYDYLYPENLSLIPDVAGTMTYDPSTATAYAVCLTDDSGTSTSLCISDLPTGKKTPVGSLQTYLHTLASTAAGQLYGVGSDGVLYKVNKYTAELTEVGSTGVIPTFNQSAVIDYSTNVMYWSAYTDDGGALYTVDITTGEATLVTKYDDSYQLSGLFIKQTATKSSAPSEVTGLAADFEGASLAGKLTFSLPETDVDGNVITGDVDWTVTRDGDELASGSGQPGSVVEAPVAVDAIGNARFIVCPSVGGTPGAPSSVELWVGMDVPRAVTDVAIALDGETVTVSWTMPERGIHNGYVDLSKVRYIIDRGPQDVTIETAYRDTSYSEAPRTREDYYPVMYRITPYVIDGEKGEGVVSDYVLCGNAPDLAWGDKWTCDFNDPFNSLLFKVVDANNDDVTWHYDYDNMAMCCEWPMSSDRKRDDWLISTPVVFGSGYWLYYPHYCFVLNLRSEGMWSPEEQKYLDVFSGNVSIYLGREPEVSAMNIEVLPERAVTKPDWHDLWSKEFYLSDEDCVDTLYVGIHLSGGQETQNIYNAYIKSLQIHTLRKGSVETAGVDNGFSAEAAAGGIVIDNPAGEPVRVVAVDGRVIAVTSEETATISVPGGIYIVTSNGKSVKIAVR